jgi:hypothetical protein
MPIDATTTAPDQNARSAQRALRTAPKPEALCDGTSSLVSLGHEAWTELSADLERWLCHEAPSEE